MIRKIGLAGKSGSGKDLVADFIGERYSFKKIAVADAIREEAETFIEYALTETRSIYGLPYDGKANFDVVIKSFMDAVWGKPTSPEMRILLQWWGTEYRRAEDSEYWTKKLEQRLDNDDWIVVSDIRTPTEMEVVRKAGGEVWFVERPGVASVGIPGHFTEVALEGATYDKTILNDGTIEDLKFKIEWLFKDQCSCKE